MSIDQNLRDRLEVTFRSLSLRAAANAFPPPSTLAGELEKTLLASATTGVKTVAVNPQIGKWFTTAAIEMWRRGVHSFLISASLTDASPIWASVSGYYSSHYSIRGLAHLLGYFQLFRCKRIVRLELQKGSFFCTFDPKNAHDREHKMYWKVVKQNPYFASDPLFTFNSPADEVSDVGHRDISNYADHISLFPTFRVLDQQTLKDRVGRISQMQISAPPIPRRSSFPDVEAVQIVAYQRLVRFRQFVDEIAGGSNRFWKVHRAPSWARDIIDFQLSEQRGLGSLSGQI